MIDFIDNSQPKSSRNKPIRISNAKNCLELKKDVFNLYWLNKIRGKTKIQVEIKEAKAAPLIPITGINLLFKTMAEKVKINVKRSE